MPNTLLFKSELLKIDKNTAYRNWKASYLKKLSLSLYQSKSSQSNLDISFELTSNNPSILIDFPATYRFEHVDSTGWHFSLVFPTLPPPSPLSRRSLTERPRVRLAIPGISGVD